MKKRSFGSAFFVCSLSLAVVLALCAPAGATLFTSKAAYTGDWSEGTTWTNGTAPSDGDDAQITNAGSVVILSIASSNLNSLILGKTLTFTNWNTSLTATNVTILTNGVMTLPGPFNEDPGVSNNIYIVCSNLTIGGGGTINADRKGYIVTTTNNGRGYGPGAGTAQGGGSYGGRGGTGGGVTYGNVSSPLPPGSAGGTGGGGFTPTGDGGGAIRIQASGSVTINGTITANGGPVNQNNPAGSGGGIYITCRSLTGTGGVVRANGGAGYISAGAGGGGRIAVIYDTNAQASIPAPSVVFQTTPGVGSGSWGDAGTLYFPDNFFLTETFRHSGYWSVPGITNWAPNNLLISNGWLQFTADGFPLTVSNNLNIVGTDNRIHQLVLTNGVVTASGDIFLYKAALVLRCGETAGWPSLDCGGNLILSNNSAMYVFSGPTNGGSETAWGTLINVANNVQIKTNAVLYLSSHPTNGGSALLRMRNLTIDLGGTINADERGYVGRYLTNYVTGYGPGKGYSTISGGYGGRGAGATTNYGLTYGNSNAPTAPGSSGGTGGATYKTRGGGGGSLARIQASHTVTINGTITANGGNAIQDAGSGSGGGIYLTCRTFSGSANGLLRANGGAGYIAAGGGGGGRIAVWRIYDVSSGAISNSASGGAPGSSGGPGENGTVVWGMIPNPGTLFVIQ